PQQSISRKIADHLVINYPEVETGVLYSEELEEYLERRFGKYVREFNADLANRFGFGVGISAKDRSECFSELPAYISDNTIKRAVGAVENPDVIDYLNKLN
ncbi:hypothetical protein, partial [Staphylococcus aureus]|uniref:hypothetical protein n=1 Tax=Staphylococcus aureus TaxID=1280 RepID=UPI00301C0134